MLFMLWCWKLFLSPHFSSMPVSLSKWFETNADWHKSAMRALKERKRERGMKEQEQSEFSGGIFASKCEATGLLCCAHAVKKQIDRWAMMWECQTRSPSAPLMQLLPVAEKKAKMPVNSFALYCPNAFLLFSIYAWAQWGANTHTPGTVL